MPTVQVAEVLRRYAGVEDSIRAEGATVREVFESLFTRFPDLRARTLGPDGALWPYLLLFRNGAELPRAGGLDAPLAPDDVLEIVGAAEGGSGDDRDVRMRGFRERVSVEQALAVALDGAEPCGVEAATLETACGRVLAQDVRSTVDVPPFPRSAMDGYAVRAEDTFGATPYDPVALVFAGESMPGAEASATSGPGRAVRIMTGARIPDGADAVVPAESAREVPSRDGTHLDETVRVSVEAAVTPGKNVGRIGEDVKDGDLLLVAGRRLRPQDVGLLASIGVARPAVVRRPRVRILVTGNELLPPGVRPFGACIADSNTPMLQALVARDGGLCVDAIRASDDREAIRAALDVTREEPPLDVLIAAGGTSVGREDFLPGLVRELGALPVHGVAMRPSSPTGIGRIGATRVFLLPGNPVSCLAAYDVFAGVAIRALAGLPRGMPYPRRRLRLGQPLASQAGRTDYCRVRIEDGAAFPIAIAGASVLSSTTRADGFVLVPEISEGFPEGAEVDVFLYDAVWGSP